MKMSPESKSSKKNYPSMQDYKRKLVKATFTLSVVLSPFAVTSCMGAYRPPIHEERQIQEVKVDKKENNKENIVEPIQKKGDISDPVHVDDTKKEPCNTDKEKKEEKKNNPEVKEEPKIHHTKTRGIMKKVKDDK